MAEIKLWVFRLRKIDGTSMDSLNSPCKPEWEGFGSVHGYSRAWCLGVEWLKDVCQFWLWEHTVLVKYVQRVMYKVCSSVAIGTQFGF